MKYWKEILVTIVVFCGIGWLGYIIDQKVVKYSASIKPTEYGSEVVTALNGSCKNYNGVKHFTITQSPLTITVTCNFSNEIFATIKEVYIIRESVPILNKQ